MEEEWRKIEGYDNYSVSNYGQVKSLIKNCILNPRIINGYHCVRLYKNNKYKEFKVHRLVGLAFIPNPENLPQVHHINQIRNDNRIDNLKWVTCLENNQSINTIKNIGCLSSFTINRTEYWRSIIILYGKRHQFYSKDREKCETWLNERRVEIENGLNLTEI